jgi:pyruvate/2-oxoglutarate dehydrogenase complex dihydrolipoamide acyltransferase (E2) component
MRRVLGATALAVTALLALAPVVGSAAQAAPAAVQAAPAAVPGDDIFYPNDQAPSAKPSSKPAAAAPAPAPAPASTDVAASSTSDREAALAQGDREAADMMGWMPSLYQGKWFMAGKEDVRRCIMDRESNFNYRAVGAGTYFGAYQMNRGLAVGATYTMAREVAKEMGPQAVAIVEALRKTPVNSWNRYWQDRAFWTIWHGGDGAGNWRGGGTNCF